MIRTVKIADESFFTMDDYEHDLVVDDNEDDLLWSGEDEVELSGVPADLWSPMPLDRQPPEPERWIDQSADQVEIDRLKKMGVYSASLGLCRGD